MESEDSASSTEIGNSLTASANEGIASPTSAVAQPKLDNGETASANEGISFTTSAVVQPKLESEDSASSLENSNGLTSSANEGISPTAPGVIQPKLDSTEAVIQRSQETQNLSQNTEIPQLPTVLQNISVLSPLSQQSNFLTSNFVDQKVPLDTPKTVSVSPSSPSRIQKSPSKDVSKNAPDSWNNIAELISENTVVDNSQSVVAQPLADENQWDNGLTSLLQSSQSSTGVNIPKSRNSSKVIQAKTNSSNSPEIQKVEDNNNQASVTKEAGKETSELSEDERKNMEVLAREIYKKLQQRLEIEQERQGRNYSGRLPW
ncbi:hypothetical protein NIES4074_47200 [Cylindrospermum sp. NIES-4074]|nr:hypothetical protein NIES4074_47200 [Cylindrospermum sp. NIES-4074]